MIQDREEGVEKEVEEEDEEEKRGGRKKGQICHLIVCWFKMLSS